MEEAKNVLKNLFIRFIKPFLFTLLIIVLIFSLVTTLLAAATYFIFVWVDGIGKDDWSNPSYAVNEYTTGITVGEDGTISSGMTFQEIWDKMIENGSRVDLYLDGPEELAKLMNAEIVTQYPDMRNAEEINEPIEWKDINIDNPQGIIKFRRADNDGTIKTISYVSPDTYDYWMYQYNSTGDATARSNILSHFTIEKTGGAGYGAIAAGDGVMTDVSQAILNAASSTPSRGQGWCLAWVNDVYDNAGVGSIRYATAYESWLANGISTDMSAIPIGAAVYGTGLASNGAGHVGIYIGGGMVMDNQGAIVVSTMEEWLSWQTDVIGGQQGWLGWGWCDGNTIRGTTMDPNMEEYEADDGEDNKDNEDSEDKENEEENDEDDDKIKGQATAVSGDGYNQEYTSSTGFTYKEFKQDQGSYKNNPYWNSDGGIIGTHGCGPTSVAILASGLTDLNYSPATTAQQMNQTFGYTGAEPLKAEMDSIGLTSEIIYNPTAQQIQDQLKSGKVLLVSVVANTVFANGSHIMAVLDINDAGQVYISNPWTAGQSGWTDINTLASVCNYIVATDTGKVGTATSSSSTTGKYCVVVGSWTQTDGSFTWTDDNWEQATDDMDIDVAADEEVQEGTNEQVSVNNNTITSTKSRMTYSKINYQEYVDKLTMPFNLLWSLLVIGEDKSFVFDLADLVYNSTIEITIFDNITVDTNIENITYGYQEKVEVEGTVTASGGNTTAEVKVEKHEHEGPVDPIYSNTTNQEDNGTENNNGETTETTQTSRLVEPSATEIVDSTKIAALTSDWWDEDEGTLLDQEPPTQEELEEVEEVINGDLVEEEKDLEHTDDTIDDVAYYYMQNEVVTTTNTITIALTRANVWMMDYVQDYVVSTDKKSNNNGTLRPQDGEYKYLETKTSPATDSYTCVEIKQAEEEVAKKWSEQRRENGIGQGAEINATTDFEKNINLKYYYRYIGQTNNVTNNTQTKKYIKGKGVIKEKVDKKTAPNFVTLFNESDRMGTRSNIRSASSWLFEIMEHKEDTDGKMLEFIKYLLYKATDTDYGVTDFDFSYFFTSDLTSVGAGDYIVHIDKSPQEIVIKDVETLRQAFTNSTGIAGNTNLANYADAFIRCQEEYRVNAVFAAAVAVAECGAGTNLQIGGNNWFSIRNTSGGWMQYSSPAESIEAFCNQIARLDYYFTEGKYTVSEIGMTYCENADAPGGWIDMVTSVMTQIFNAAGIDTSSSIASEDAGDIGNKIVAMAKGKIGCAYVYGGNGPDVFDCSGFTKWCYAQAGIEITRTSETQMSNAPKKVSVSEARVGDILYYPGHVGIYIGNGEVIHAANPSQGVVQVPMSYCPWQYALQYY